MIRRAALALSLAASPRLARPLAVPAKYSSKATRFDASAFPAAWPYTDADMARLDESKDILFYSTPRFVTHIDDGAIKAITAYYDAALPDGADVLDLCSSWVSHLPEQKPLGRVTGLGMNARELEANPRLTEFVAADLNTTPQLPFEADAFDACLNVVSVDYLNRPREVFEEMHRVLRPGGQAIMSFSNRCFPSKAVNVWLNADDAERQRIVASYFHCSVPGGWDDVQAVDISPAPAAPQGKSGLDMMRAMLAGFVGGDPMFVVRATKV